MLTLLAAITAVRAFGISRGVFRYLERLAAHDAAFRVLGELRGTVYARLATLAPAGPRRAALGRPAGAARGRRGRAGGPVAPGPAAVRIGGGRRRWARSPSWPGWCPRPASCWPSSLLVTAVVAPLVAGGVSRRAEARLAPGRGELADAALDLLRGAPEIMVAGAAPRAIGGGPAGRRAPRRRRATIRRGRGRRAGSSPRSRRARRCGPPWCSGSSRCARAASAAWPSPSWR